VKVISIKPESETIPVLARVSSPVAVECVGDGTNTSAGGVVIGVVDVPCPGRVHDETSSRVAIKRAIY
jgi:hypothetical protein